MTTKADERIARIEDAIGRLETLGLTRPSPSPAAVNPDGSPGHVSPGELIESAWGNATSDEFQRVKAEFARTKAWVANRTSGLGPIGATTVDLGMSVVVPFVPSRAYLATVFLGHLDNTLDGACRLQITDLNNVVQNETYHHHVDGFQFSMYTSVILANLNGTFTLKARILNSAGTITILGSATQQNYLMVQELPPYAGS